MKVLAFTDLHNDKSALKEIKKKAKKADLLIDAGDQSIFGHGLEEMISSLDKIGKPILLIHGNHEYKEDVEKLCKKTKNIKFIHKKHHKIGNVLFLGYGGGGFTFEDPEFKDVGKKFKDVIKNHKLIFIVHGPPYNTKLDLLFNEEHVGNLTVREFIEEVKPEIVITGHMHETFGEYEILGDSYVVNPGPTGKFFEI